MMKNLEALPIKEWLADYQSIPYDISWMSGNYFVLSPNFHKAGDFEVYFGKNTKLKQVIRLRAFGNNANFLLRKLELPLEIDQEYKGDLKLSFDDYTILIAAKDDRIISIDIVSDIGVKNNNGYFKSMEKFSKITEAVNCDYIYGKLIGAWDLDLDLTYLMTAEKLNDSSKYGHQFWQRFVFFRCDDIMNMHHYRSNISSDFTSNHSSKYNSIFKITKINKDGYFIIKTVDLKFGCIESLRLKFDGDKLIYIYMILNVFNRIGETDDYIVMS